MNNFLHLNVEPLGREKAIQSQHLQSPVNIGSTVPKHQLKATWCIEIYETSIVEIFPHKEC